MNNITWVWTLFTSLTWWEMILWAAYSIYFILRSWYVWEATGESGLKEGYRRVFFGRRERYFRLYHLIRMIFDIPPIVVGTLFPALRKIFTLKIYEFKSEEKN